MSTFDLKAYMKARAQEVDRALESYLPAEGKYMGNLGEVMRYGVFPGGKRFRPVVALAACEALGGERDKALPAACAFELVHCFSLIHDDLPCMDNDVERRGKPTCHVAYGEDTALLAGDGLVIHAFEVAAHTADVASPEATVRVMRELAFASGHQGMVGGQILDMEAQHHGATKESLMAVHYAKTGALIRGSARAGAIIGGANEQQLAAITEYSELVGLVFQITDDILDYQDDPDPISFPGLYGLEESKRIASASTEKALKCLEQFGDKAEPLAALAKYLLTRQS